jgi:uncharacterized phiE125 gp8 family phage protein
MAFPAVKRIEDPLIEPVSVETLRLHLRLDSVETDTLLTLYLSAARDVVERYVRRQCLTARFELWQEDFLPVIRLPYPPLQAVESVMYVDSAGVPQWLSPSVIVVNTLATPGEVSLRTGSTFPGVQMSAGASGIRIIYIAGYGDSPEDVPGPLRSAILLLAADLYENPTAQAEQRLWENKTLCFLLASYRLLEMV